MRHNAHDEGNTAQIYNVRSHAQRKQAEKAQIAKHQSKIKISEI
jgi:hypothetical protein